MITAFVIVFFLGLLVGWWAGVRRAEYGIARASGRRAMKGRADWRK